MVQVQLLLTVNAIAKIKERYVKASKILKGENKFDLIVYKQSCSIEKARLIIEAKIRHESLL